VSFGGTVKGASDVSGASTSQGQAELPTALGGSALLSRAGGRVLSTPNMVVP
jgi:hypothetical protein